MASDIINKLRNMYDPKNRYANFGNVLIQMETHGIRGVDAIISFDFPVTVIVGKNGAGKSTIGQLALCCYRYKEKLKQVYLAKDYYNLGSFFIKSRLDPEPYLPDAFLRYEYAISLDDGSSQQLSLFDASPFCSHKENLINKVNSDWGGYKKRPDRKCVYFGMGFFVPHHDMGDRIYLDPKTQIIQQRLLSIDSRNRAAKILDTKYQNIEIDTIKNQTKTAEMGFASRFNASYSENHMGCGEGRLIRMINALEQAPEKSLFVIEEPETALHQDAQHNLANYFLEVCVRKRHQIIITTHSPSIIETMPMEARKLMERTEKGTGIQNNPTIARIISEMSNGHQKSLLVYVEDEFAKKLLTEIVRLCDSEMLTAISIASVGNINDVKAAVRYTKKHPGIFVIGVCDEKRAAAKVESVFSFPYDVSPESMVFYDPSVIEYIKSKYNLDVPIIAENCKDHHDISSTISRGSSVSTDVVEVQCIQEFIAHRKESDFDMLMKEIKTACESLKSNCI